jgi:two-component system CheB/CheR fusion protein
MRVLIVDDNADLSQTLKLMVDLIGHETAMAGSAAAAFDKAKSFRPHVVLMDIGLPDMDGFSACRQMRGFAELDHTVFIAQSGRDGPDDLARASDAGFGHYLVKPTSFEHLERLLGRIAKNQIHG